MPMCKKGVPQTTAIWPICFVNNYEYLMDSMGEPVFGKMSLPMSSLLYSRTYCNQAIVHPVIECADCRTIFD